MIAWFLGTRIGRYLAGIVAALGAALVIYGVGRRDAGLVSRARDAETKAANEAVLRGLEKEARDASDAELADRITRR